MGDSQLLKIKIYFTVFIRFFEVFVEIFVEIFAETFLQIFPYWDILIKNLSRSFEISHQWEFKLEITLSPKAKYVVSVINIFTILIKLMQMIWCYVTCFTVYQSWIWGYVTSFVVSVVLSLWMYFWKVCISHHNTTMSRKSHFSGDLKFKGCAEIPKGTMETLAMCRFISKYGVTIALNNINSLILLFWFASHFIRHLLILT